MSLIEAGSDSTFKAESTFQSNLESKSERGLEMDIFVNLAVSVWIQSKSISVYVQYFFCEGEANNKGSF